MKYITTLLIVLIAFCMIVFTFVHHPIIDRFNPLLNMEDDYAKVPKNTQYYENITVFDKDGKSWITSLLSMALILKENMQR